MYDAWIWTEVFQHARGDKTEYGGQIRFANAIPNGIKHGRKRVRTQ